MTERFYPIGTLPAEDEAYKSTYTVQNEMRSFHRSAYPPGYAGHEPGVREKHGYASPGPHAWRLANPEHTLTEEIDNPAPRMMHAVTRSKAHDMSTYTDLDLPIQERTLQKHASTGLSTSLSQRATRKLGQSTSLPELRPLTEKKPPLERLEDARFTYFVPKAMSRKSKDQLLKSGGLSKLEKADRVVLAIPGEGTGFRAQGAACNWWPHLTGDAEISAIQRAFTKPPFHRAPPSSFLRTF